MADPNMRIGLYEARTIVPIQEFTAGTTPVMIGQPAGNSLLSTLYVQSIDPGTTVRVNYYDFGPGDGRDELERIELNRHTTRSVPGSERITVARISNKPRLEVVVTGGNAILGIHIAVVSDFPDEIDPATFYKTYPGDASFPAAFDGTTTPGAEQTLIELAVGEGQVRHLHALTVALRMEARFTVHVGGDLIGSGRTGGSAPNASFVWRPYRAVAGPATILVKLEARAGSAAAPVEAFLGTSLELV